MKRYSILQDDMERCFVCDKPHTQKHEIFFGKNRNKSIKYGLVVGLCLEHHTGYNGVHTMKGVLLNKQLKEVAQKRFQEYYNKSEEEFIKLFGKNRL